MYKINLLFISVFVLLLIIFSGCLKDNPIEQLKDMKDSEELLVYFETNGDYINNIAQMPSYVKASEVYQNLDKFLIIDIRSREKFIAGRIPNSVNVSESELFDFVSSRKDSPYTKIVIVSETGQESSYATALLRLAGFNKVFTLQWGMASWHRDFSWEWYKLVKNSIMTGSYDFINYPKPDYQSMPDIDLGSGTTKNIVTSRIKFLLKEGFNKAKIDMNDIMSTFNSQKRSLDFFVICYAPTRLYNIRDNGHPPTCVRYEPYTDLKSSTFLQTLPSNKPIAIYDDTGEISAHVVAYLRTLGYNAYSINLGANGMIGEDQSNSTRIIRLRSSDIMNYPYHSGE